MIQRIQSVYLALAGLLGILMCFFPLIRVVPGDGASGQVSYLLSMLDVQTVSNGTSALLIRFWPLVILNGLVATACLFIIFSYGNRKKQMHYAQVLLLMEMVLIGLLFFYSNKVVHLAGTSFQYSWSIYTVFPLLQVLFTFLAKRAIRKDEELVRSADRLR